MTPLARSVGSFGLMCLCLLQCHAEEESAAPLQTQPFRSQLPLMFVENRGQAPAGVRFVVHSPEAVACFSVDSMLLYLPGRGRSCSRRLIPLRVSFHGRSPGATCAGWQELPGKVNYLLGNDPVKWVTGAATYRGVTYRGVWPGIDVTYRSDGRRIARDIRIAPGADVGRINFRMAGAERVGVSAHGDLEIQTAAGKHVEGRPIARQQHAGRIVELPAAYRFDGGSIGFEVTGADASSPLVITTVAELLWSTFLGGTADDPANALAVDASGCAYVAGSTSSSNFPTNGGLDDTADGTDAFVAKLSADGSSLVYATFLGGSGSDAAYGIAVDPAGSAYVAGYTASTDFPTPAGYDTTYNGNTDAFVAKLSANGSSLAYSTFLGGAEDLDEARGIALDSAQCAYITGRTLCATFPFTLGAYDTTYNDDGNGYADAFVTKLSANGLSLIYSTFLGGSLGADEGRAIAVDSSNRAYVAGYTSASDFPTHLGYDLSFNLGTDVFVTKVDAAGSALVYSTFIGGSGSDYAYSLALDSAGCVYITGATLAFASPYYPITGSAFDTTTTTGNFDGFVTKLSSDGTSLVYSTFLGGSSSEWCYGVAVDAAGCAYVTGGTLTSQFPVTPDAADSTFNTGMDAFLTKFNDAGSIAYYSTFLGGTTSDTGYAVCVGPQSSVYVAGQTGGNGFPITPGAYRPDYGGGANDTFVARLAVPEYHSPSVIKRLANSTRVETHDQIVTAVLGDYFYLESDDRSAGIRVYRSGHGLVQGQRATVVGTVLTDGNGERYINASSVSMVGSGTVDPVGVVGRAVGGGRFYNPAGTAGQQAVLDGIGLNNIGLLIKTWGCVTQVGPGYIYVDDGQRLSDGTLTSGIPNVGVRVVLADTSGYLSGDPVEVTGIASCFKDTSSSPITRRILTRSAADVRKIAGP